MAAHGTNPRPPERGMRISGRLMLLLAIPLVALLGITGYGVHYGATRSAEASRLQDRTDLGMIAQSLVGDLQVERSILVEDEPIDAELRARIESTGELLDESAARIGGSIEIAAASVAQRLTAVGRIADAQLGGDVALRNYSRAIDELLDFSSLAMDPTSSIDDAAASTYDYLARARAASAEEHDLLVVLGSGGSLDAAAFQKLTALASAQERYVDLAAASASAAPDLQVRIVQIGHEMRAADVVRRAAFAMFESGSDQAWLAGLDERTEELGALQADAAVLARAVVDDLARSSRLLLVSAAFGALVILLTSAYLLRRAIRTIVRPLQDLAAQAEDVARTRLPDAVKAQQQSGGDELHLPALRATGAAEVHEVASAFNDVQDTALRLAGEQAALRLNQAEAMTNLGRRNQTLLARQLDFISSLETRETDPAFLEHLFKLDHLASRMRRNAESLLILAGSETPRRRRTPAPVTEVVRAAMSEVEEFERVRIGHLIDATVSGPAVIDLVHLLAELIENALGFSPPETTVEIDGRSLGQGGYQFAVIDRGVGMTDLELLAANQRISGADELEGMPTRYLGQYVVAKLAAKLGAMVRLQTTSGGRGVTAVVNLPDAAMLGAPDRSSVARPLPGSRAAREQGPVPFAPGAGVSDAARTADVTDSVAAEPEPVEVSSTTDLRWQTTFDSLAIGAAVDDAADATEAIDGADSVELPADPLPVDPLPVDPLPVDALPSDPEEGLPLTLPGLDPDAPRTVADPWSSVPSQVPPPAPLEVPEQIDWTPRTADHLGGESRVGGLVRRVPGASLAERQGTVAAGGGPAPERSATGVQSMLASFQAGRSRGRQGAGDDTAAASTTTTDGDDPSTDWRSTT